MSTATANRRDACPMEFDVLKRQGRAGDKGSAPDMGAFEY
jgi:hypothetical protein